MAARPLAQIGDHTVHALLRRRLTRFALMQGLFLLALAVSYAGLPDAARRPVRHAVLGDRAVRAEVVPVPRRTAQRVTPLYDDPELISDADLTRTLNRLVPRFPRPHLKPNAVEHALRTWGVEATFDDPAVLSGAEMRDFLLDHGRFLADWGPQVAPLLEDRAEGVAVRWDRAECGSVHHDHLLACLSEAGVPLDQPVFTPGRRNRTFGDVLQESLRDFRLDEKETEWSALAYALWLAPEVRAWRTADERTITFDRLAEHLMRGDLRFGVCGGTHRVYTLTVLLRLDAESPILSTAVRERIAAHLGRVRDLIVAAQFPDGHWRSNWPEGAQAPEHPVDDPEFRKVIATGHHLEWLSIAPPEFQPPREVLRRAAAWLVRRTSEASDAQLVAESTYFSHVACALAGWRGTRPLEFLRRRSHAASAPGTTVEARTEAAARE